MYGKELNRMKEGKFCSIAQINREWDLKLNGDLMHRIQTSTEPTCPCETARIAS